MLILDKSKVEAILKANQQKVQQAAGMPPTNLNQVAVKLGVSRQRVYQMMDRGDRVTLGETDMLARALGVDVSDIVSETEET